MLEAEVPQVGKVAWSEGVGELEEAIRASRCVEVALVLVGLRDQYDGLVAYA